jgi:beta-N-acetylhexosaminidase
VGLLAKTGQAGGVVQPCYRHFVISPLPDLLAFLLLFTAVAFPAGKPVFQTPAPVHFDKSGEKWAERTLKKMSLEQKVGQMFMIWSHAQFLNVNSPEYIGLRDTMRKYHLGGFGLTVEYIDGFLYKNEPLEAAMITNQLQRDAEFPLLFAADFERGLGMRLNEVTGFPHAMAFGAARNIEFARESGRITAMEARAIGVQWNWFPDVDVNSNPDNPVINTRSFGEDPKLVGQMAVAYIEGAHEFGMLTTAKHFPGHGDTDVDSHLAVPVVTGDRARLDAVELPPFESAIKAGVDAVLVAHVSVPALDPDPKRVASISPPIVTGLLKQQLGFHGLVVTDALQMAGLMKLFSPESVAASGQAAVAAVKAGNDVLLIPADIDAAYNGVLNAVRSGVIPQSRIDQSVLKILRAKASVGLNKARLTDINAVNQVVAKPRSLGAAQRIADNTVTLVRDNKQVLPLERNPSGTKQPFLTYPSAGDARGHVLMLIFSEDSRSDAGRLLDEEFRNRIPTARVIYVDPRTADGLKSLVTSAVEAADKIIVAIYEVPVSGRVDGRTPSKGDGVAVQGAPATLLQSVLQAAAAKTAVVAMGSPYIAAQLPEIQTYLCTFSNMKVSEISAVKAMFGEIPITGRLPVTIPNVAPRGAGLTAPAQRVTGGSQ